MHYFISFTGKSTYCRAIAHHLINSIKRDIIIVNLDPANDRPPYQADVDVQNLIEVDEVFVIYYVIQFVYS